ncbi:MAG: diguanylate cyclase [Psychrobium sp.]|nr:diguanylate cyclase [Psychrobium sp.]
MINKMLTRLTIGQKIVSLIVLVSMFSIMIAISGLSLNEFRSTQDSMKREITMISNIIAENMKAAVVFDDNLAAQELLAALSAQPIIEYARVSNKANELIAEYGNHTIYQSQMPINDDLFEVKTLLYVDDKIIGTLIVVANDVAYVQAIQVYFMVVFAVFCTSFVFSVLLSIWVQRRFATPIIDLANVAKKVALSGDYSLRAKNEIGGEIGQLLTVFNGMLKKIDHREQELEALVRIRTNELEELNKKLADQAYYDSLTKLPNRSLFEDRLKQSIAHAARENTQVALMFVDLDKFKEVNDTWGHAAGDALLCQVARRLEKQCRVMDTVARIGGDEFTMLFILEENDDISEISRRIVDVFQVPFDILNKPLVVTMSVGVAVYPTHGYDYDVLKAKADEAMYKAKRLGRNQFCIHQ